MEQCTICQAEDRRHSEALRLDEELQWLLDWTDPTMVWVVGYGYVKRTMVTALCA